jgi:hypothetical protein
VNAAASAHAGRASCAASTRHSVVLPSPIQDTSAAMPIAGIQHSIINRPSGA